MSNCLYVVFPDAVSSIPSVPQARLSTCATALRTARYDSITIHRVCYTAESQTCDSIEKRSCLHISTNRCCVEKFV
jgi:hypothetical protein